MKSEFNGVTSDAKYLILTPVT